MATLFPKADLLAILGRQQLLARLEQIGADPKGGILALLVLAQLRANACQQDGEPEGLGYIVIGAGLQTQNRIGIRVVAGQHDHRRFEPALASSLTASRPSMSGSPTSMIIRSTCAVLAVCMARVRCFPGSARTRHKVKAARPESASGRRRHPPQQNGPRRHSSSFQSGPSRALAAPWRAM